MLEKSFIGKMQCVFLIWMRNKPYRVNVTLSGGKMKEKPYWNHEVETRSVEAQAALDKQAVRQQLEYVYNMSFGH